MKTEKVSAILIPGLGSSHRAFTDLVAQSALSRLEPIFYEYAGFHDRPQDIVPSGALHVAADEIIGAAEKKFSDAGVLIGHSMGGAVALLAAGKRPDLFAKGVVLIESNMTVNDGGLVSRTWAQASLEEAKDSIKATIEKVAGSLSVGFNAWAEDLRQNSPEALKAYAESLVEMSDSSEILLETFEQLNCPRGYIYGDDYATGRNAGLIEKLNPYAHNVNGAQHFVMQDNPVQSAAIISSILKL